MRSCTAIIARSVAAAALITLLAGCKRHQVIYSSLTTTVGAREVKATIDGPASISSQGDAAIVTFGRHRVQVARDHLALDGVVSARIPAEAAHVHVAVAEGTLTVTAEGANILTTKIE